MLPPVSIAWRALPVMVITGQAVSAENMERLREHVERILQKGSCDQAELLEQIRALVQRSAGGAGSGDR